MIAKGNMITIVVIIGLIAIWLQRFYTFKKDQSDRKNNIISLISISIVTLIIGAVLIVLPALNGIAIKDHMLFARFSTAFTKVELQADEILGARIIDWREDTAFEPMIRTIGSSIGSYKEGRFTLRNRQPALVYTNTPQVLLVEVEDYVLLLGPDDFDAFINQFDKELYQVK